MLRDALHNAADSQKIRLFRLQRENAHRGAAEAAEHWEKLGALRVSAVPTKRPVKAGRAKILNTGRDAAKCDRAIAFQLAGG